MALKRKAASLAPAKPFHMATRKRARLAEPADQPETAPPSPSPPQAPGSEQSQEGDAVNRRASSRRGRNGARGGRGGRGVGGRGHGGSAWNAGEPSRKGGKYGGTATVYADELGLQYVDPKEKEESPHMWIDPRRDALEARMEGLNEAYKKVFTALKPALEELADRTLVKLRTDQEYHKRNALYAILIADLQERLQKEVKLIEAKARLKREQQERRLKAEMESIDVNFKVRSAPVTKME